MIINVHQDVFNLINRVELYGNSQINTMIINGDVWFKGKDIASVLGYVCTRNAIRDNADTEDKKPLVPF